MPTPTTTSRKHKVTLTGQEIKLLSDALGDLAVRWIRDGSVDDPDESRYASRILELKVKLDDLARD